MKNKFFLLMAGVLCLFMLGSCKEDASDILEPGAPSSVKQVDMTVMVPIQSSSLKYFDYLIKYSDNNGAVHNDTIQSSNGGIVVDDWDYVDIEITLCPARAAAKNGECYVKTYSYNSLPVAATATVEMVPKKDVTNVGPFSFYIPKPYMYPNVCFSSTLEERKDINYAMEGVEPIRIDSMSVSTFQSLYGTMFTSHCIVREDSNGLDIDSY